MRLHKFLNRIRFPKEAIGGGFPLKLVYPVKSPVGLNPLLQSTVYWLVPLYINQNLQSLGAPLEIVRNATAVAELFQRLSTSLALLKATFFFLRLNRFHTVVQNEPGRG